MAGHGSPYASSKAFRTRYRVLLWVACCALATVLSLGARAEAAEPTMQLRIAWGGGSERLWRGTIRLSEGTLVDPRPLGIEADEPGSMWIADGQLQIVSRSPRAYDGVDLNIVAPMEARLIVNLSPSGQPAVEKPVEIELASLVNNYHNSELDSNDNRLLVRRAPGDQLRVKLNPEHSSLVFSPGETLRLNLLPRLLGVEGAKIRFDLQLIAVRGGAVSWSEERELAVDDVSPPTVPLEVKLPATEGVYDLVLTARTRNRLRLWHDVAQRKVQLVVIEPTIAAAPLSGDRPQVKLAEINPAEPLNPAWWNRFAQLAVLPGFRNKAALGTGDATPWRHPQLGETLIQLGPGGREPDISWEAYPLPIEKPGEPHVLEIDYPSDVPQFLGISIVEPNAAGAVLPVGLDSGVYVADEAAQETARLEKHRLIFWPRTRSPLVLLTNRRSGTSAVYGRMRLFGGQGRLPRALPRSDVPERLWAGYVDRPLFPENFSAPDALDNWSGISLDDWSTFYEGVTRMADYLNHIGQNGLMVSVLADGSTIYPSQLLEPTPRYDTGVFFGTGQDPLRKDILEMMLRVFDREHLVLIPQVQFASPLPELEELLRQRSAESVGVEWIGPDGASLRDQAVPRRGKLPYYNPLHPRVQEAMLAVVRELVSRYGAHPSFNGLSLDLTADGYAVLPGIEWGMDDVTVGEFQRAHPQLQVPGVGATRFADRARFLTIEHRAAWVAWRADQLQKFLRRVRTELTAVRPEAMLYLGSAGMFSSPESQQALRPQLPRNTRVEQLLQELGLRASQDSTDAGIVLLRPQQLAPVTTLEAQGVNLEINQSADLDRLAASQSTSAAVFYHSPQEARLESFDAKSPFKRTYTWLMSQPLPSGQENRRRFIRALAAYDVQKLFDGGAMLPLGQEAAFAGLIAAYRKLPTERFATLPDCPQPVTVRMLNRGNETWFYAVNDSPWPVTVALPAMVPKDCRLSPLDTRRPTPQLTLSAQSTMVEIKLEPYDMAGGVLAAPRVKFSQPTIELPPTTIPQLEARMRDLGERQRALAYPRQLDGLPRNNGFEEPAAEDGVIPGWTFPASTAAIDNRQRQSGGQSVHLRRGRDDRESWLRSDEVPAPKTGRFTISAWLRVPNVRQQPAVRLAAEWQAEGRRHYRYAALGRPQFGEKEEPIPDSWKWYIFSVKDLPPEGVSQLRVRLELMGEGEVWVDEVRLYDLLFDADTEQMELIKMNWHYTNRLQEGQVGDCLQFLESYWPRYLTAHVPLVNRPSAGPAPPPRTATQPKLPPSPNSEPKKSGFFDRLKEYVPGRSWF